MPMTDRNVCPVRGRESLEVTTGASHVFGTGLTLSCNNRMLLPEGEVGRVHYLYWSCDSVWYTGCIPPRIHIFVTLNLEGRGYFSPWQLCCRRKPLECQAVSKCVCCLFVVTPQASRCSLTARNLPFF